MNPILLRPDLLPLIVLCALGTYAARAIPLLAPGVERLPAPVLTYLRFIGPAALGAIAATAVFIGDTGLRIGPDAVAVGAGALIGRWRASLLIGLLTAVALVIVLRATIAA